MKKEWLSNAGFNNILSADAGNLDKQTRLEWQWILEQGVWISNFQCLATLMKKRSVVIEVMGTPCAGKQTVMDEVETLKKKWIVCSKEPYRNLKDHGMTRPNLSWLFGATLGETLWPLIMLHKRGLDRGGVGLVKRGLSDQLVMARARYKNGEISEEEVAEWGGKRCSAMDATILMMVNVHLSMRRGLEGGRRKSSHSLDNTFLSILYQEYVNEFMRMVKEGRPNLVLMNMDGDIEANTALFRKVLTKLTRKEV